MKQRISSLSGVAFGLNSYVTPYGLLVRPGKEIIQPASKIIADNFARKLPLRFTANTAVFSDYVCGRRRKKEANICRISGQIFAFVFAVLEDGAHEQKCEVWLHSDKTRCFQRG